MDKVHIISELYKIKNSVEKLLDELDSTGEFKLPEFETGEDFSISDEEYGHELEKMTAVNKDEMKKAMDMV